MKTTVVIPNYNGKKYLAACLKSLEESEKERPCVLVVDNGSTDGSGREAEEGFPWIRLIRFPENRGFDAAVNEGIRQSHTPYVFLLNNDTIVRPGCISALEERMEREENLFSVSARMVDMKDPSVMDGAGDLYSALGWAYAVGKGKPAERYGRPVRIFSAWTAGSISAFPRRGCRMNGTAIRIATLPVILKTLFRKIISANGTSDSIFMRRRLFGTERGGFCTVGSGCRTPLMTIFPLSPRVGRARSPCPAC